MEILRRIKPVEVLVIDDSPVDRKLLSLAFAKLPNAPRVRYCDSGRQALSLIFPDGAQKPYYPTLCLVDYNMPAVSGLDVLRMIKADERTRHIPVFILSSSEKEKDIHQCYQAGANGYFQKPRKKSDLDRLIENLTQVWVGQSRFSGH